ncbi:MAG TPA: PKD domain-containing protein [Solirubrobacteraceae bacterium]|nr:PKD domain-containing protein [Solirubrobacteraceae bacterium]
MLAALAGLLAFGGPAAGRSLWLGATDLSSQSDYAFDPDVAADPEGEAIAVWSEVATNVNQVWESTHPPDGAWQAPVMLGYTTWWGPQVVVDSAGDATVAWGDGSGVEVSERPYGGTWRSPVSLGGAGNDQGLQLAEDSRGDTIAVWEVGVIVYAATRPAGGEWQPPFELSSAAESASGPQVALDAQGDAVAVWQLSGGPHEVIQAAVRPAVSGVWQAAVTISNTNQDAGPPALVVDPEGNANVLWPGGGLIQSSFRPAGGSWQTPVDVSASGGADPQLAVDSAGDATAVWDQSDETGDYLAEAAQRPVGAAWEAPVVISDAQAVPPGPQVVTDARGDAVAIWDSYDGSTQVHSVQAAVEPAGGAWQAAGSLSGAGGDATAVWDRSDGTDTIVQAAGLDTVGPRLDGLSIPTAATVGVPVAFSASAFDVWSLVQSTSWSFGDGATAPGPAVTHTYTHPGSYPVTVTSTDLLGNATSTTATIAVAAAPATSSGATNPPTTPSLTRVTQTHTRWREGTSEPNIARRRAPVGTTFAFTVNEPVRVTLTFTQAVPGRRRSARCRAMTRQDRGHETCRRTIVRGTLTVSANTGAHHLCFQGRIGHHELPLGPYTAKIVATNATTHERSATKTLHFTIVR